MGCNRWQFQELHRLCQELKQLTQKESNTKMTELVPRCETDKKIPSLFWQEEDRDIKDEDNKIRLDQRKGISTKTLAGNTQNSIRRQHRIG